MLWDRCSFECDNKSVSILFAAKVVFDCNVISYGFNSSITLFLSQSPSRAHLITTLQVLSVLCGLVVTGQPAKLSKSKGLRCSIVIISKLIWIIWPKTT